MNNSAPKQCFWLVKVLIPLFLQELIGKIIASYYLVLTINKTIS